MEPEEIAKDFASMVFEIGQHAVFKEGGFMHPVYFFARFEKEDEMKRRMEREAKEGEEAADGLQLVYAALPTMGMFREFMSEFAQTRLREICMQVGVVAVAIVGEAKAAAYPIAKSDVNAADFVSPGDMENCKRVLSVGVMLSDGRSGLMLGDIETKEGMSYVHKSEWHFGESVGLSPIQPWTSD